MANSKTIIVSNSYIESKTVLHMHHGVYEVNKPQALSSALAALRRYSLEPSGL